MKEVTLGDEVKDVVTSFTGIAIATVNWINGCRRVVVQPQELKDGKPIESQTFDIEQLVLVQAKKVVIEKPPSGGPMPDVSRGPEVR